MTQSEQFDRPWLVAVGPGMGHVALSAGYYLMSKLSVTQIAEFSGNAFFDIDAVVISDGLVQEPQPPRSRLIAWKAPAGQRDVIVFIGESQLPLGKFEFCSQLLAAAAEMEMPGVFMQLPYPKASLAVRQVFNEMAGRDLNSAELAQYAETTEHRLERLVGEIERRLQAEILQNDDEVEELVGEEWRSDTGPSPDEQQEIERLLRIAAQDRSKAIELKSKLDELGLFDEYEDRFLDLFKKGD